MPTLDTNLPLAKTYYRGDDAARALIDAGFTYSETASAYIKGTTKARIYWEKVGFCIELNTTD